MTHGFILGKFMPPHRGHKFLIDFGQHYADELTVLVCSHDKEPIPGHLRYRWMQKEFPHATVLHLNKDLPQEPSEHLDFWNIWRREISDIVNKPIDYVFASEQYGGRLAQELNATFIPVDYTRAQVAVSGSSIRDNPHKYWDYILPAARSHFVKRVCIYGPESTGKTTLAKQLADHYKTTAALEYARLFLDHKNGVCDYSDIPLITAGQAAAEEALVKQANKVFFTDTDALTTTIWSDVLFGAVPQNVKELAAERSYDLYLLLDIDVPWVDDKQRTLPHRRKEFFERCKHELEIRNRPYVIISGNWNERFQKAVNTVDQLINPVEYALEAA
jgi:NadR type nicotinamide-nucleotide adenylyltransferase